MPERRNRRESQVRYFATALIALVCLVMVGILSLVS